ncbi:MAG: sufB, partial [Lacrimispora sp.]|nr:sufB [Lacrimispora sp.]
MKDFKQEKTRVDQADRTIYDVKDRLDPSFLMDSGITPEIVNQISMEKNEPEWMRL